jgi:hypothetical protein
MIAGVPALRLVQPLSVRDAFNGRRRERSNWALLNKTSVSPLSLQYVILSSSLLKHRIYLHCFSLCTARAVAAALQHYFANMESFCLTESEFPSLVEDSEKPTVDPQPGDSGDCFEGSGVLSIIPESYYHHHDGRSIPIPLLHIRI